MCFRKNTYFDIGKWILNLLQFRVPIAPYWHVIQHSLWFSSPSFIHFSQNTWIIAYESVWVYQCSFCTSSNLSWTVSPKIIVQKTKNLLILHYVWELLHWLPVARLISFKIILLGHSSIVDTPMTYFRDLFVPVSSQRAYPCSGKESLKSKTLIEDLRFMPLLTEGQS